MDGFMASAATGAMSSLLSKLGELLGEDCKMQRGMRREIAFLKDELSSMNALLERLADLETLDPSHIGLMHRPEDDGLKMICQNLGYEFERNWTKVNHCLGILFRNPGDE